MFVTQSEERRLAVRMGATLENIDRADEDVSRFLSDRSVPVDLFAMRILVREALMNAVIHGSGKDQQRTVRLDIELGADEVVLTTEDSGPGFRWAERGSEIDILGDGGRGLALMHIYSSAVTFNESGNRVVLRRAYATPEPVASNTQLVERKTQ